MKTHDERVDAAIARAADFAKPILLHIRGLVHRASPQITETIKWGMPFFEYKGPVCMMAVFKQHCAFGFWKASRLRDPEGYLRTGDEKGTSGSFGRISSLESLPPDVAIIDFVRQAIALNEEGAKPAKKQPKSKPLLEMPADFQQMLDRDPAAKLNFENFSSSGRREYLEWFAEAKTEQTREKRLQNAIEMIAEGKTRNWKYRK